MVERGFGVWQHFASVEMGVIAVQRQMTLTVQAILGEYGANIRKSLRRMRVRCC
jgi:hypothetical protein